MEFGYRFLAKLLEILFLKFQLSKRDLDAVSPRWTRSRRALPVRGGASTHSTAQLTAHAQHGEFIRHVRLRAPGADR
jgi:hypothetical protein